MLDKFAGVFADAIVTRVCRILGSVVRTDANPCHPAMFSHKRILVVKPCCLGDSLMSTPAIAELKGAIPSSKITVAVSDWAVPAVKSNPDIDEIWNIGMVGIPRKYGIWSYIRFVRQMRSAGYDACFVLDRSPLMGLACLMGGIPIRLGIDSVGRGFALTHRVSETNGVNEATLYLDVVKAAGVPVTGMHAKFRPSHKDILTIQNTASELGLDLAKCIAIAPGGGVNPGNSALSKRWSPYAYAQLVDHIFENTSVTPILVGTQSDAGNIQVVMDRSVAPCVDLHGTTSFGELGALISKCQAFVGNDSALAHLAAAVDVAGVAVFTVTDPRAFKPSGRFIRTVIAGERTSTVTSVARNVSDMINKRRDLF